MEFNIPRISICCRMNGKAENDILMIEALQLQFLQS